jgi:hypothetical protein
MVMIPGAERLGDMPSGEPIPEGIYLLRIDKATFKPSKEKGTPMVEAQMTVFGPATAEEFVGRKVFENLLLSGPGAFKTRQLLEVTGETEDFVLEDTDQLIGREFGAVVQIEPERKVNEKTYSPRNKVGRFLQTSDVE